jgi:GTP cyclohydrolase II
MNMPSRITVGKVPVLFKLSLVTYKETGHRYYVLEKGKVSGKDNILVRIDSKCVYAHIFGSARCDCREQLLSAMKKVGKEKDGLLIYCYDQDGRGIPLREHLMVYQIQDQGYDTVEANIKAGLKPDQRKYDEVIDILNRYQLKSIRLLTNNPDRLKQLSEAGINVTRIPFKVVKLDKYNAAQLIVKQTKLGHMFEWDLKKNEKLFNQSLKQIQW